METTKSKPKTSSHWEFEDFINYLTPLGYKSSGEFKRKSYTVYLHASTKKFIDRIRDNFGWVKKKEVYPHSIALKIAKQFNTFEEWKSSVHYDKTINKMLVMGVMKWRKTYSFETCFDSTKDMGSIVEWRHTKRVFHDMAIQLGFFDKICAEKKWVVKKRKTLTHLFIEAFSSKSIEDLKEKNKDAYERINEYGWGKEIFAKTEEMKDAFLKNGFVHYLKVEGNVFPVNPRLKKILSENFWQDKERV